MCRICDLPTSSLRLCRLHGDCAEVYVFWWLTIVWLPIIFESVALFLPVASVPSFHRSIPLPSLACGSSTKSNKIMMFFQMIILRLLLSHLITIGTFSEMKATFQLQLLTARKCAAEGYLIYAPRPPPDPDFRLLNYNCLPHHITGTFAHISSRSGYWFDGSLFSRYIFCCSVAIQSSHFAGGSSSVTNANTEEHSCTRNDIWQAMMLSASTRHLQRKSIFGSFEHINYFTSVWVCDMLAYATLFMVVTLLGTAYLSAVHPICWCGFSPVYTIANFVAHSASVYNHLHHRSKYIVSNTRTLGMLLVEQPSIDFGFVWLFILPPLDSSFRFVTVDLYKAFTCFTSDIERLLDEPDDWSPENEQPLADMNRPPSNRKPLAIVRSPSTFSRLHQLLPLTLDTSALTPKPFHVGWFQPLSFQATGTLPAGLFDATHLGGVSTVVEDALEVLVLLTRNAAAAPFCHRTTDAQCASSNYIALDTFCYIQRDHADVLVIVSTWCLRDWSLQSITSYWSGCKQLRHCLGISSGSNESWHYCVYIRTSVVNDCTGLRWSLYWLEIKQRLADIYLGKLVDNTDNLSGISSFTMPLHNPLFVLQSYSRRRIHCISVSPVAALSNMIKRFRQVQLCQKSSLSVQYYQQETIRCLELSWTLVASTLTPFTSTCRHRTKALDHLRASISLRHTSFTYFSR